MDTPQVVMETPEQIVVSQESEAVCLTSDQTNEEVCYTEPHHEEEEVYTTRNDTSVHIQDIPGHAQDTDGIQFVAYSTSTEEPHPSLRRSTRKRQQPNHMSGTKLKRTQ